MKKYGITVAMVAVLALVAVSSAETIKLQVSISADSNGRVTVTGPGAGQLATLVQFCPDEWADDCNDNVRVPGSGGSFQLNQQGLREGQTEFNFVTSSGLWLRTPASGYVLTGSNVSQTKGREGGRFRYTGALAGRPSGLTGAPYSQSQSAYTTTPAPGSQPAAGTPGSGTGRQWR